MFNYVYAVSTASGFHSKGAYAERRTLRRSLEWSCSKIFPKEKESEMNKGKSKVVNALLLAGFLILLLTGANSTVYAGEEGFFLPELQPYYSADEQAL